MIRTALVLALATALAAACSSNDDPAGETPAPDACGAGPLQSLIGRNKTEIPQEVMTRRPRVACTTCPVTMDYRPDRLNIFFDEATGVIREVKCG